MWNNTNYQYLLHLLNGSRQANCFSSAVFSFRKTEVALLLQMFNQRMSVRTLHSNPKCMNTN
jgi:hypothetical protein